MALVTTPEQAVRAAIRVMQHARQVAAEIVDVYAMRKKVGDPVSAALWKSFGEGTIDIMVNGCRTLAMIWDSAWKGNNIDLSTIRLFTLKELEKVCSNPLFLPSRPLDDIADEL
jgi:hypothetical protein